MKKQMTCLTAALCLLLAACTSAAVETTTTSSAVESPPPSPTELATLIPAPVETSTASPLSSPTELVTPTSTPTEAEDPAPELALAIDYLTQEKYGERVYSAAAAPQEPQEGDFRVDGLTYLGEQKICETAVGVAYQLNCSRYLVRYDETGEKTITWTLMDDPIYLVLERSSYDDSWQGVKGNAYYWGEEEPIEDLILRVVWGLFDLEVSLTAEGYPQLVGIGSRPTSPF